MQPLDSGGFFVRESQHQSPLACHPYVLVADDNPALRSVLQFNLERAGFRVAVANNGLVAFDIAQREKIDLLIADQEMPGMSGIELTRRLRTIDSYKAVPIFLLVTTGLEPERSRLRTEIGISEFFLKPFSPRDITRAVEKEFSSKGHSSPMAGTVTRGHRLPQNT